MRVRTNCFRFALLTCAFAAGSVDANAAILVVNPVADGYAFNLGGIDTNNMLRVGGSVGNELRSAIEFAISSLPENATINSATLSLVHFGGVATNGVLRTMSFALNGFAGDGIVSTNDLQVTNAIAGPFTDSYGNGVGFSFAGLSAVDVTQFLQSLHSTNADFAGFALRPKALPTLYLTHDFFSSRDSLRQPALTIDYTVQAAEVPEPSSLFLVGAGASSLLGLCVRRRRQTL